jgi:SOS response regulatory protein OraA/RecX
MDPAIIDLTTKVMTILLPLVSKGAEEFAGKVGDAAYEKAKSLLMAIKQKWSGDQEVVENLARFEEKPERYKVVLEDILREKLSDDRDFASKLSQQLREIGPALEVIQEMDEGRNITGLRAKEMGSGKAKVTQHITKADSVTGADLDIIG